LAAMSKTFAYHKKEKLKSRKQFTELFAGKQSVFVFPVKVFFLQPLQKMDYLVKAGVGANSRNFKKAVDRNRIKRLLREAYRLNKLPLHEHLAQHQQQLVMFFLYVDKVLPDGKLLQAKMPHIIRELIKRLDETVPETT
jgi:ribonuclease P protein component